VSDILSDGLALTAVGLAIVFSVLGLIALFVTGLGRLDAGWRARERRAAAAAVHRTPTIDTTTAVLIAAAAATIVQGRHRIRSIRRLPPPELSSPWSAQGRAVLQGSHVIQRRR
jgi:Na+-transporting methylmalonyl-CoA/oxaloacetate decarboxylase gamma subunit